MADNTQQDNTAISTQEQSLAKTINIDPKSGGTIAVANKNIVDTIGSTMWLGMSEMYDTILGTSRGKPDPNRGFQIGMDMVAFEKEVNEKRRPLT